VTRGARPMLGCKSFAAVHGTLVGIAFMHMLKKGHMVGQDGGKVSHWPNSALR
jgi:hypothetical protein